MHKKSKTKTAELYSINFCRKVSILFRCRKPTKAEGYLRPNLKHATVIDLLLRRCCTFLYNIGLQTLYTLRHTLTVIILLGISLPGGTGKRRPGVGRHALISGCPEHWTIRPKT